MNTPNLGAIARRPQGGGMLENILGPQAGKPRFNRLLEKFKGGMVFKVPENFSADEHNVILGLGTSGVLAAGATFAFTVNAPRDLILRKLVVYNVASLVDGNFSVTGITVEGNALLLGNAYPGGSFVPGAFATPVFDVPAGTGTPIQVNVQNTTAAAVTYFAGFLID